ncbi:MAG TPA: hypothetical protein DCZ94_08020 [Lentisphaeria bacterium]|nr:MAG: hypothetical protein A2X48_19495 [Lentisphaerae bacterium GWF2_49_21]HBC86884.1 hypothetical protein [Lentisphaeria bacterium]
MICVAGHQPNLYPYGGFFAKAASVDVFVIVDNTQYVKKEYHNRNRIRMTDGSVQWLSIPVKNAGRYRQPINAVEIDNSKNWRHVHSRTLFLNYKKARHFDFFYPKIAGMLEKEWVMLADFNISFIRMCFEALEIRTPLKIASSEEISGVSSHLILDICRKTGAGAYLHGKHSLDYVDFDLLRTNGIISRIQDFSAMQYEQVSGVFVPNLSILDIIFNCGPASRDVILKGSSVRELQ